MTAQPNSSTRSTNSSFPFVVNNAWHQDGSGSAAQGPVITVSREMATPLIVPSKCTLIGMAINIGVAFTTPGTVRAGMRVALNTSGLFIPGVGSLLDDYGTQVESAATLSWTGLSRALSPAHIYFPTFTWQGGVTGSPTASSRNRWSQFVVDTSGAAGSPNTQRTCYFQDGVAGALGADFVAAGTMVGPSITYKLTVP